MPVAAIIPIRSFTGGKDRLSSDLTPDARARLGRALAARTVEKAEHAMLLPAVVSGDEEVFAWVAERGLPLIVETGPGLDRAASDGVAWALEAGLSWVVLHADLPLVTEGDLATLEAIVSQGVPLVAPSADGGTSAISAPKPVEFSYGVGSAHRHMARLGDVRVVAATGLLHDLDSMRDLRSATTHREGSWLRDILS